MNFAGLLKRAIGLDVCSVGEPAIDYAVRRRMTACGIFDRAEYWDRVQASPQELQELIEAVVVPETWFFRHREAFDALAKLAPGRCSASRTGVLRLLSAPCSTGEEPYSMAMALAETGLAHDRFLIHAVDISVRVLERAQTAVYGANSFRNQDLAFRDRHFTRTAGGYLFAEDLRRRVQFQQRNLLAADFSSQMDRYDFIFCRNVLIYFDLPTQEKLMASLRTMLLDGGCLFVGPAEATLASAAGFTALRYPSAFAFVKGQAAPPRAIAPRGPAPAPNLPQAKTRTARAEPLVSEDKTVLVPPLQQAETLANAGRFLEAAEICQGCLRQQGDSAQAYYLLGLLADAQQEGTQAVTFYRKALYLDPAHGEALVHLALLLERRGDGEAARRLRQRAGRIEGARAAPEAPRLR